MGEWLERVPITAPGPSHQCLSRTPEAPKRGNNSQAPPPALNFPKPLETLHHNLRQYVETQRLETRTNKRTPSPPRTSPNRNSKSRYFSKNPGDFQTGGSRSQRGHVARGSPRLARLAAILAIAPSPHPTIHHPETAGGHRRCQGLGTVPEKRARDDLEDRPGEPECWETCRLRLSSCDEYEEACSKHVSSCVTSCHLHPHPSVCVFTDFGRMTTSRAVKETCSSKTHTGSSESPPTLIR